MSWSLVELKGLMQLYNCCIIICFSFLPKGKAKMPLIRGGLELGWQGIVNGKLSLQVILTDHLNYILPDTLSHRDSV